MKKLSLLGLALVLVVLLSKCKTQNNTKNNIIDYFGQAPPENTPIVFAPNVISLKGRFERVPAFSPDGKEFYTLLQRERAREAERIFTERD